MTMQNITGDLSEKELTVILITKRQLHLLICQKKPNGTGEHIPKENL